MTALRGSTTDFPLESVIGLVANASKTGELQIRGGDRLGALGFANGRLVAAVMDGEGGENALGAIFAIREADFEFTSWASAPDANLEEGDLAAILKRAAEARDRFEAIRAQIPDDRLRFKLSEKAADHGAVTFTPERWRALLAVNGERDVLAIAEQLRLGRMETLTLLAGLVKDEVIETKPAPAGAARSEGGGRGRTTVNPTNPQAPEDAASAWNAPPPPPSPAGSEWNSAPATERPTTIGDAESAGWTGTRDSRDDLNAEIAARFGNAPPAVETSRPEVPPAVDDRLASLGVFAPGPAANAPSGSTEPTVADPWAAPPPTAPSRPADSWTAPPPAATETPANAWAPTTTQSHEPSAEPAPPSTAEKKKTGGLFSMFRREETAGATVTTTTPATSGPGGRPAMLASLANALLTEYGSYGKGKMDTRMASLLMRVDEQADPIDRPLPVVDDQIDPAALERETFPEEQVTPYLATLVRQIFEDAERAFGKDKAKKGYRAVQQQVVGVDQSALHSPDLAGKLPKV